MVRHICHRRRWSYSRRQQTDLARLYAFSGHSIRRFVDNIIIHILRKRWPCETSQSSEYFTLRISAQPKTNFERKYFDNFDRSISSVSKEQHTILRIPLQPKYFIRASPNRPSVHTRLLLKIQRMCTAFNVQCLLNVQRNISSPRSSLIER